MSRPFRLTIDQPLFERLYSHLFPGDGDEHGAVITAGVAETDRGPSLLAREVFLARDGVDYVPGKLGYRALTAEFVAHVASYCAEQNLSYLAVHCHGGTDSVEFSYVDFESHERGYPALVDITKGGPVGALVFAERAVAGDIWTMSGRHALDRLTVVGPSVQTLFPSPPLQPQYSNSVYDRQARLFGDVGQHILSGLKVGIIGLGGGGSLLSEWLSRLGIGHIVAVDFDRVDVTNLSRVIGATRWDAKAWFAQRRNPWLQKIGRRFARLKVDVARRVAKRANPRIRYDAIDGDVLDESTARLLTDVDFLVLASDSIQSRLVFNSIVHQYLIPGAQIGAKVSLDENGQIEQIFVATRPVLPFPGGGCLQCHELIPAARLQMESLSDSERRAQRYVDDEEIVDPSVITLNVLSAGQAANDLMMMFTGLYQPTVHLAHQISFVRERTRSDVQSRSREVCLDCGNGPSSRRARGDRFRLPCRMPFFRSYN